MRTLRLTWSRTSGALPFIVAAAVTPAACSSSIDTSGQGGTTSSAGAGGTTSSNPGGTGGIGGVGGTGGIIITTGGGGTGGEPGACPPNSIEQVFDVEIPAPGVPAEPGQICAQNPPSVTSNTAARVTLTKYSTALEQAMGFVAIAPDLQATVIGTPTIEVVNAAVSALEGMVVSNVAASTGGFSFHAEWPAALDLPPQSWVRMDVRTSFVSQCGPSPTDTRVVESITTIHLCLEGDDVAWVSSGDECKVCEIIAEMAPSPIVSDKQRDDLPLGRALRLRVRPIVKVGRAVVLMAENDGGPDLDYAWRASGGDLQIVAADVVVWTPPEGAGPHLVQAAVTGEHTAGVASYTLEAA